MSAGFVTLASFWQEVIKRENNTANAAREIRLIDKVFMAILFLKVKIINATFEVCGARKFKDR